MRLVLTRIIVLTVFLETCLFAQDRIFLKSRPDGNRGYVVELSDKQVVIRFPAEEIEKIERGSDPANAVETRGDAKPPMANRVNQPVVQQVPMNSSGAPAGEVVGQMVFDGQPLRECRVKLVPLQRKAFAGYVEREDQLQVPITSTDTAGNYRFTGIPPGAYKLKWAPNGEAFWTRKVGTKPDVVVEPGQVSVIPALEVHKYVIGR